MFWVLLGPAKKEAPGFVRTKRVRVVLLFTLLAGVVVIISSSRADEPGAESLPLGRHYKEAIRCCVLRLPPSRRI
jgi:hypothetical protein